MLKMQNQPIRKCLNIPKENSSPRPFDWNAKMLLFSTLIISSQKITRTAIDSEMPGVHILDWG